MSRDLRVARAVVTLVFLLSGAAFSSWAARIPPVRDRLELSEASLGLALAMLGSPRQILPRWVAFYHGAQHQGP